MKNKLLHWILRRFPVPRRKEKNQERRFLVVSTTALGDTLWATPAIASLRAHFPQAFIGVLVSPIGQEVLEKNPCIDQTYLLKSRSLLEIYPLWKTLVQERFDTILFFHASQRFVLPLVSRLGADHIIGTAGINKGGEDLLTLALPNKTQHEIVRRLEIVKALGAQIVTEIPSFFNQRPSGIVKEKPWIALHPGSKDPFKRWPASHFIALGKKLLRELECELWITGTEESLLSEIVEQIPQAKRWDGKKPLAEFADFLSRVDLFISNDTGPVHLGCALNTPLIALYSSTDPKLCGPHKAPKAQVLYKKRTCEPCLKKRCRRPFCLLQIGVDEVFNLAMEKRCQLIQS